MLRTIDFQIEDPRLQLIDESTVPRLIQCLDQNPFGYSTPPGDLALLAITPDSCSQLHLDFFGDPEITDVMTFPGDLEDDHAGDIAVCPQFAASSAPEHNTSFAQELSLYIIHGWLHLAGFLDKAPEEIQAMRKAESNCLSWIRENNAFPPFNWTG